MLTMQHVSSGRFSRRHIKHSTMEALLNMIRYSDHVTTKTIRNMLKDDLPASIPKSSEFIVNLRIQAQKYLKKIDGDGITNSSKVVMNE